MLIAWTYFAAWNNVVANQAIINKLVADVARIRRDRFADEPAGAELAGPINGQEPIHNPGKTRYYAQPAGYG